MGVGKLWLPARVSTRRSPRGGFGSLRGSTYSDVEAAQLRLDAFELLEVGGLTAEEVNKLMSIAESSFAKPGDVLKRSDAITSSAYEDKVLFIVSGSADILQAGEVAREVGPGDFVGESEYLQLEVTEKLQALSIDPVAQFFELAGSFTKESAISYLAICQVLELNCLTMHLDRQRQEWSGGPGGASGCPVHLWCEP